MQFLKRTGFSSQFCRESIIPTITLLGASKKEQYQLTRALPPPKGGNTH